MKFLTHLEEYFIAFLLTMMTIMTAVNAFFRYVLQASLSWVFELNTFMFAGVIFLGMAWGVRVSAHIGIDFVVQKFPNKQQRVLAIIATLLCMLYAGIVLVGSYIYVSKMYMIGIKAQDIHWLPQWVPRLVLPVGFALLFIRFAQTLYELMLGKRTRIALANEAKEAIESFQHQENNHS